MEHAPKVLEPEPYQHPAVPHAVLGISVPGVRDRTFLYLWPIRFPLNPLIPNT